MRAAMRQHIGHRGRRISYLDASGPGALPGQILMLLHAFPLAAEMWRPQLEAVPPGWRYLAPDLRGFGESHPGDLDLPASIDDFGDDVIGLLDALGLDRAVVAGLSMGGYAALSVHRLAPARVRGLVLADTRAEADGESARQARDAMIETLIAGGAAAVFERMEPGLLGETTRLSRPAVAERVRTLAISQPADGIRRGIERMKARPDATPQLPRIGFPTLVIGGEEDQITTADAMRDLHGRVPGSTLAVVPRAGHLPNLENPDAFNAALAGFLRQAAL
jgi:3-oxoadipate enol-lactonase